MYGVVVDRRVAVEWIDVGGSFQFVLAVWGKRGALVSCALVILVVWVVLSVSLATRGLKMGQCGFGLWSGFEARLVSFPCWAALLFVFVFCFNLC